jgi:NADPH:quinone reductase-like Zn-dependent oxidoreductase
MTMRVVQIDRFGGPEVLDIHEAPEPSPNAGEVLVRTVATSINPIDAKLRTVDRNLGFPLTLGWDLAGVVVESSVSDHRVGDRVIGMSHVLKTGGRGTWADLVAMQAADIAPAPSGCALAEASSLPLAGLTALQSWQATDVQRDARVLVVGAAGAVGGFYSMLAVNAGVTVDGLVSRGHHVDPVQKLGLASVTADPGELQRGMYDTVFDTVGPARSGTDPRQLMKPDGNYVTPAVHEDLSGIPNVSKVLVHQDPEGLSALGRMVDDGALQLRVAAYYPVQQIREAHQHFETGGLLGKVIVVF